MFRCCPCIADYDTSKQASKQLFETLRVNIFNYIFKFINYTIKKN